MEIEGAYVYNLMGGLGRVYGYHRLFGEDEHRAKEYIFKAIEAFKLYGLKEVFPEIPLDLIYEDALRIPNKYSSWSYNPLKLFTDRAQKAGIKVHFWVEPFWNEPCRGNEIVLEKCPDFSLMNIEGKEVGLLDTGKARVREFVLKSLLTLMEKYRPDGINLDYFRYPADGNLYCYCEECRQSFKEDFGFEAPDPRKAPQEIKKCWYKFLDGNVTEMVRTISEKLREDYPGLIISAYVWGRGSDGISFQDWPQWITRNYIDFIIRSGYSYEPAGWLRVDEYVRLVDKRIPAYVAIGIHTAAGEIKTKQEFLWHLYRAEMSGADGVVLYHYPYCLKYLDF